MGPKGAKRRKTQDTTSPRKRTVKSTSAAQGTLDAFLSPGRPLVTNPPTNKGTEKATSTAGDDDGWEAIPADLLTSQDLVSVPSSSSARLDDEACLLPADRDDDWESIPPELLAESIRAANSAVDDEGWERPPSDLIVDSLVLVELLGREKVISMGQANDSIRPNVKVTEELRPVYQPKIPSDAPDPLAQSSGSTVEANDRALPNADMVKASDSSQRSSDSKVSFKVDLAADSITYDSTALPPYWAHGQPTPYQWLTDHFAAIEKVTGRLIITNGLTNMLRTIIRHAPQDLLAALYLCSNNIAPSYEGVELGLGPQIMLKAITAISDMSAKKIKTAWEQYGDWGDCCMVARVNTQTLVKPKPLQVVGLYQVLRQIAKLKGQGTVQQKTNLVKRLMVACQGEELRFLARTLVSHIRIGAVRTTIMIALSHAILLEHNLTAAEIKSLGKEGLKPKYKEAEQILKECFAQVPNYDCIVGWLLDPQMGLYKLRTVCQSAPGIPIRPMLGKITRDLAEVFEKLQGRKFCADYKYDGQRAQIHCSETGKITIFSRHLEMITEKYPDIVANLPSAYASTTTSFILDSEVVAVDDSGSIQPFQTLSNRGRKNVDIGDITVKIKVFAFDLMFLNGKSLLKEPFRVRRDAMRLAFKPIDGLFDFVPQLESSDAEEVQEFLNQALQASCEGLMVKLLDPPAIEKNESSLLSTYEPDKRSESWLKVKKDYLSTLADSFDLVPIGAWYGTGRKATWYSPYLMAAWNPQQECWESVCKCMSGFSDAFYKSMKEKYAKGSENVLTSRPSDYSVSDALTPSVWFRPMEVWEIRGADLTVSPVHRAGVELMPEGKGISLRFPRFMRIRDDKGIDDATTSDQIVDMFYKQRQRGGGQSTDAVVTELTDEADEAVAGDVYDEPASP
ncbi:hypothetical protein DFS34DRAFT_291927 [Phlyctochytrium arcticum]|nr:hypothetical protein DFS34DRAFT_291927 [Phlyctochytrium arcticum]